MSQRFPGASASYGHCHPSGEVQKGFRHLSTLQIFIGAREPAHRSQQGKRGRAFLLQPAMVQADLVGPSFGRALGMHLLPFLPSQGQRREYTLRVPIPVNKSTHQGRQTS